MKTKKKPVDSKKLRVSKIRAIKTQELMHYTCPSGKNILVRSSGFDIVEGNRFVKGIKKARQEVAQATAEISKLFTQDLRVKEIELSLSFSAQGNFLGFGVGGATAIKLTLIPIALAPIK